MFKKVRSKLLAMILAFFMITGFMPANFNSTAQASQGAVYDYNLVFNGDAEADDFQMFGWTTPTSPHFTVITEGSGLIPMPSSSDGGNVFDLYVIGEDTTATDSISQTIDIFNLSDDIAAGLVNVKLSAEARKLKADSVHTLTMELLNDSAEVLQYYSNSGSSTGDNDTGDWQDIIISQDGIDANTASIRITLTGAINTIGSGDFVEFDAVSLILTKEVPSTPAPAVTSISPNSGPTAGGTSAVSANDQFSYVAPLAAPYTSAFEVVVAQGSVSADLLGVYYENGTVNGRPCYEGPNGYWISYGEWIGNSIYFWFIGKNKGDSDLNGTAFPIYYGVYNGLTPPLNTNFTPGQNPGNGSNVALKAALPPEMNINGNGISISDGDAAPSGADSTDFGSATIGEIITKTYTIENTGEGALRLGGTPIVSVSGTNAADFSVTQPSLWVLPGSSITFTVDFEPLAAGTRTAAISIANNDQDENPYNFAIQGTGNAPPAPEVTTDAATGVDFTEATLNGTVNANGTSTAVSFEYGLTAAYGTTVSASPSPLTGSEDAAVSAVINGLSPYTKYYYRVTAVNAGGSSSGSDRNFTTGAAITYNDVTKNYGDPDFIHTASGGSSTGAFSYASSDPAVAGIDAATGSVTILKAGTTTLTATKAGDSNFSSDSQACTLKVNKADLTATVGDYSRTYGDANPAFAVDVTGFVNGETAVTAAGYTAPTAGSTATATTASGTAAITISGGSADNYTFNTSDTGILTINKALLTATVENYSRAFGEANPTFTVNVSGFKNGETSATATGYAAPTASCEATAATATGTAPITISGGAADNYTFDISDTGVLNIGQAVLTATVGDYSKTYGEANPAFAVNVSGFQNGETAATAAGYTAPTAGSTATATTGAGTAAINISGGAADNYTFDVSDTGVLAINKALLAATVGDYSRSYGDANPAFAVNVTGFVNGETSATASGYAAPTASSTAIAATAPGTAAITITGGAADNYTFEISDTGVLTIGKAILTATVEDYSKTYGQANPAFAVDVSGFKNGETSATAAGYAAPTASSIATATTAPGTAAITISGGAAENYTFDISDTGVLTIGQVVLTATVGDYSKTYGEANPAFAVNVTGFINGETAITAAGYAAPTAGSTATATTAQGTALITISGGSADNYTFNTSDTGVLTINKALLAATVGDYSRSYGDANPAFAVDVSGFKNGETSATAAGYAAPTARSTATATTAPGTAAITISGGAADNYTFDVSDTGVLTINKALLTATVGDYSKTYGDANPAFAVDVSGFKNGETSATAAGYAAPTASSTATATTAPGTAAITISGGAADNYTFDISDTGILTIDQAVLTATVGDYSKTYGQANPAFAVNVTGFINGETATTAAGYAAPTAGSTATDESGAGTAEITISGGAADYYTFDTSDQGVLTINPRELTVTAHVNTKYYDGSPAATGIIILTGIIFDDEVAATGIFTFEDGKTGKDKNVFVTDISLAGADAANYWVIDNTTLKADIMVESNGGDYEPPTRPDQKQIEILVNGKTETAATATIASVNGQTVATVLLDAQKVAEKLEQAGERAVVTILAPKDSEVLVGQLTGQTVKNLEKYQAVLGIKNGDVTYTLPAAQLNIDEIAARLGNPALKDIIVSIKIAEPSEGTIKNLQDKADKNGYKLMIEPIEFTITCKSGSRTTSVAKFASYVERTVAIPEGTDPGKITTAAVFNQDGSLAHVPTIIIKIGGKYYARISSLSNSIYTLIYNPRAFADMENHWAEQAVNDMGSRLVISGVSEDKFEPGRAITRAEFAAIMVRGLGLKPENGSQIFSDVDSAQWYSSYINAAYQYGIISGYGEGTFEPTDKITREQAMSMIARAMDITGLEVGFGAGEAEALLAQFTDVNQTAEWAQTSIAACIKGGIITGQGGSLLAAKAEITRAEVAVIIKKLLQQSDLI